MEQIDGEGDVLTWGDLYGMRSNPRNPTCEGRLNVQKLADAIVVDTKLDALQNVLLQSSPVWYNLG